MESGNQHSECEDTAWEKREKEERRHFFPFCLLLLLLDGMCREPSIGTDQLLRSCVCPSWTESMRCMYQKCTFGV